MGLNALFHFGIKIQQAPPTTQSALSVRRLKRYQNYREMAKSSKGDTSEKNVLDVTLAWFMHCNFKAVETGLMPHSLG